MAILQMQKFSICALKKDRNAILKTLQAFGATQISTETEEDDVFTREETSAPRAIYEKSAQQADQALAIIDEFVPEKKGMLDSLAGKEVVDFSYYMQIAEKQEDLKSSALELIGWNKKIAEDRANIAKIDMLIEGLQPWMKLDVPMNTTGTYRTSLLMGSIPAELTLEEVYTIIAEGTGEQNVAVDVTILSADKNQTCFTVLCLKDEERAVEDALRVKGFARPTQVIRRTPADQEQAYRKEQEKLAADAEEMAKRIQVHAGDRKNLRVLSDYYRMRANRYEVLADVLQSKRTVVIEGYVAKRDSAALEARLDAKYQLLFELEEIAEDEDMPIQLKNNAYSRNYEGIVQSYGLPQKHEVDPTTIMSFFYVFFFGLMLSDAAYGALISIVCFTLVLKNPRMEQGMHKALTMFGFCGLSTLFWGIMFGGYFGDVVNVISSTWFGHEVEIPALWFVPLNDPMRLLLYSMLFGLIHLFMGLGIKGYMLLKKGDIVGFICDVVFWYCFLLGLILLFIPTSIFASIAGATVTFPAIVGTISKVLAIVGAVGLLLFAGRANKNAVLRIALGAYEIYGITSWLSDVLSYSRLLALGLATGVIAQVVNQMGSMGGKSVFGLILFIIVFIVGHTLNLAINLLGAYVHTNRLQYVEFFNKFYEGGGSPFKAFKADTKYVNIKEE